MKKRMSITKRSGLVLVALACAICLLLSSSVPAAEMKTYKNLRLCTSHSQGSHQYASLVLFKDELKTLSNGTMNVNIYPSSQLYRDNEHPKVMAQGNLEFGLLNLGFFLGKVDALWARVAPTYLEDTAHTARYVYMTPIGDVNADAWEKEGKVIHLGMFLLAPEVALLSREPIATVDDFKGRKIRLPGPFYIPLFNKLGSAPVSTSVTEVHMGLSRGTFDGVISFTPAFTILKWYEVADHFTYLDGMQAGLNELAVSAKFFNKLHPEQKKAVLLASLKAEIYCYQAGMKVYQEKLDIIKNAGVQMHRFDSTNQTKFLQTINASVKPEILDKFLGPELADVAVKSAKMTKGLSVTYEQAAMVGYEKRLARFGLE
jgi:TRAP-type C4-dicarboxylate transport system substrate-binding protein